MVYVIQVCWQLASRIRAETSWYCSQAVSKPVWHIPLLCVQWKTPDDGQRNCPKHVEFYSKNKFEKLVHLVGFIKRIYHDARSPERQNLLFYWVWHFTSINTSTFRLCLIKLLLCLQQCKLLLTLEPCNLLLSKFFLLPTDARENCFQRRIKIYIKIKIAPTCFGVITIMRERTVWACYSYNVKKKLVLTNVLE